MKLDGDEKSCSTLSSVASGSPPGGKRERHSRNEVTIPRTTPSAGLPINCVTRRFSSSALAKRGTDRLCGARGQPYVMDWETAMTHIARHQRAPNSRCLFASVPRVGQSITAKSGDFPVEFDEGGGLKNRCGFGRKSWIRQVPILRILSFCGEVAERLKATVC